MMGKTHMMIGAVVGAVVEAKAPGIGFLGGAAIGALGGLIPDLDHPNSMLTNRVIPIAIGNKKFTMALMAVGIIALGVKGYLPLPSILAFSLWLLITAFSKHRGFTHSLLGLLATLYAVHGWLGQYQLAFGAAYLSHLLADSLTDRGVPLLWPYAKDFSIETGFRTGHFFTKLFESVVQLAALAWVVVITRGHIGPVVSVLHHHITKLF